MIDFEKLLFMGMDRVPGVLMDPPPGLSVDLGCGQKAFGSPGHNLQIPEWSFPRDRIPLDDGMAAIVHAYHFLEHLTGEDAILLLREVERVLCDGGIFQFCIPYYSANIASQDLTHKSFWTEESFKTLFSNQYYDPSGEAYDWKLSVTYQVIAGVAERNLALLGQLVKL